MNKKISKELLNSATIHYRFNHKMECIHFKDIVYIKSDNSYSNIFLIEEGIIHKKMICKSLLSLEKILTPKGFLRCHKYFLVNSNKVDYFCSRTRMLSVCWQKLKVSRRKAIYIFMILLENGIHDKNETAIN